VSGRARMPTTCRAFRSGHCTHPIAPLRIHTGTPRHPVSDVAVSQDGWITFTDLDGQRHRWWHHDAARVIAAVQNGSACVRIGHSMFLAAQSPSDPAAWGLVRLRGRAHRLRRG
jgi:hypothetical protein